MTTTAPPVTNSSVKQLTLAAHKAFLREGALPIGYGPVADLAGVSRALVYTNFPSPEDLINSVLEWQVNEVESAGMAQTTVPKDFKTSALSNLALYFQHLKQYGPILHMVSQDPYMAGKLSKHYTRFRNKILKSLSRAAIRDLNLRAPAAMSFVILVASLAEEGARLERRNIASAETIWASVEKSAEMMIDGVTPACD